MRWQNEAILCKQGKHKYLSSSQKSNSFQQKLFIVCFVSVENVCHTHNGLMHNTRLCLHQSVVGRFSVCVCRIIFLLSLHLRIVQNIIINRSTKILPVSSIVWACLVTICEFVPLVILKNRFIYCWLHLLCYEFSFLLVWLHYLQNLVNVRKPTTTIIDHTTNAQLFIVLKCLFVHIHAIFESCFSF